MLRKLLALLILLFSLLFIYQYVCNCTDNDCTRFLPSIVTEKMDFLNVTGRKRSVEKSSAVADKKAEKDGKTASDASAKADSVAAQPLIIRDGTSTVLRLEGKDNFKFAKSKAAPISNAEVSRNIASTFKKYLQANSQKGIEIIGGYAKDEQNDTSHDDMGIARAEAVKQNLILAGLQADKINTTSRLYPTPNMSNDTLLGGIDFNFVKLSGNSAVDTVATDSTKLAEQADSTAADSTKLAEQADSTATDSTDIAKSDSTATDEKADSTNVDGADQEGEATDSTDAAKSEEAADSTNTDGADQEGEAADSTDTPEEMKEGDTAADDVEKDKVEKPKMPPPALQIKDADQKVSESRDPIGFAPSSSKPILTNNVKRSLRELGRYLKKNPNREVMISGKYGKSEKNDSKSPNLGIARAEAIKKVLQSVGAPPNKLKTKGVRVPSIGKKDTLDNLIGFNFKVSKKVEKDLLNLSRTLYFDTGSSKLNLDAGLKKYFRDVKTYLEQAKGKKLFLTGHTDSDGEPAKNMALGKSRAEKVKQELVKMNIPANRIKTSSKGETKPLKPNKTKAGKKANRRVEVIMK